MANIGYVTVEYADEYVATHFLSTDELRTNWEALTADDKKVLLLRSFESIESLAYIGHKADFDQPTAFPRCCETEVPEAVKAAQVENAVSLSDNSASEDAAFYERLWQFGVESYSIGNLSEKTSEGAWGRGSNAAAANGIISVKASRLLQPYLRGGYRIGRARP
nr:MAG TPA: Putative Head Tail Connector Protein [Caudoviricetes sp.]